MVRTIPQRGCAALLTLFVGGLVGLVGARPALAAPVVADTTDVVMYYTDSSAPAPVMRIDPDGTVSPVEGITQPRGLALGADGVLYSSTWDSTDAYGVVAVQPDGTSARLPFTNLNGAWGVAVSNDNTVYVADNLGHQVKSLSAGGAETTLAFDPLIEPLGLAVGVDGSLYVADDQGNQVLKHTTAGEITTIASGLTTPFGLTVDAAGNVYIADEAADAVYRVAPGDDPNAPTPYLGIDGPRGVGLGANGTLYVPASDQKIYRVTGVGEAASAVSGLDSYDVVGFATRVVPAAPTNVMADPGDRQAEVSWTAAGANGAGPVQRYVVTATGDVTRTCVTSTTSCLVDGLTNGVDYTFTVRASNTQAGDLGWSAPSAASTAVKPLLRGPGAPTITGTKLGNGSATVSFTEGAKTYGHRANFWEGSTDGTTWKTITVVDGQAGAMEATFTDLPNDQETSLHLRGVSDGGDGEAAIESVTPLSTLPGTPTDLAAEPADQGATITFTTPAGPPIDKYEFTLDNGANWQDFVGTADKGVWTGTISGLPNNENAMIRLRAVIGAETGTYSYATVIPGVLPGAPTDVTATPGDGKATITFTEPDPGSSAIFGYQVKVDDGDWYEVQAHQVDVPPSPKSFARMAGDRWVVTKEGLTNGTSYQVRVRANTSVGNSAASDPVQVTPQGKPTAPRELTAEAADNSAELTFLPSENEGGATGFGYEVSTDEGGKWTAITTADGPKESLTATVIGLTNGADVTIWLRARNSLGASDHILATVTPASPSPSPSSSSASPSPSASSASPSPSASSSSSSSSPSPKPSTTSPTVTPTTTTPTVAPTTDAPTTASPSPSPSATATSSPTPSPSASAIVPLAPSGVTASAGDSSITVSWNASAANGARITGYRATASPGPASCTTSGTSCVLGGAAGTAYTVSVVALSAAGSSPASASSSSVTPTAPPVSDTVPTTDLPLETPGGEVPRPTPGGTMTISGDGYAPFSTVTLAVYSTPTVLGTATADGDGKFTATITVPPGLSMGKHSFVAAGVDENGNPRALRLDLTVAPAGDDGDGDGGSLPVTGSPVLWMLVAGFASVLTGVALRRIRRGGAAQ